MTDFNWSALSAGLYGTYPSNGWQMGMTNVQGPSSIGEPSIFAEIQNTIARLETQVADANAKAADATAKAAAAAGVSMNIQAAHTAQQEAAADAVQLAKLQKGQKNTEIQVDRLISSLKVCDSLIFTRPGCCP